MPAATTAAILKNMTASSVHSATALGNDDDKDGKKPAVSVAYLQKRQLHRHDDTTAKSPFLYDVNALGSLRPDQVPRFFGALTDSDKLPDEEVPMDSLVAMQDRVDPLKVEAIRANGGAGGKKAVVVRHNGKHYIADGHHRLTADWLGGADKASVKLKDLTDVSNVMKGAPAKPAHTITLELSEGDHVNGLANFLQGVKDRAAVGHSFALEADREDGDKKSYLRTGIDGDGSDRIHRVLLDGNELGKVAPAAPIEARITKVDDNLGLVFGFAIVCKVDGQDYYDLNVDHEGPHAGERVPEHITEKAMTEAALDFSDTARPGNEMHDGPDKGQYVFLFPLTSDIAKAMGIQSRRTGLLCAYKPPADVLQKFKDGTYTGFSIEGRRLASREHE